MLEGIKTKAKEMWDSGPVGKALVIVCGLVIVGVIIVVAKKMKG